VLLDRLREECGLPSTADVDFQRQVAEFGTHVWQDRRPMRLVHTEGGGLREVYADDEEVEREREAAEARRRAAREQERAVEAEAYREWVRARDAGMDALLPEHMRTRA
jgi:hypothetical protein